MSVIAIQKTATHFNIAYDQQTTWGGNKYVRESGTKVFKVDDLVIGVVGMVRDNILFKIYARTNKPKSWHDYDLIEWISGFVDQCQKRDKDFKWQSFLLVIYKGRAFEILNDFSIKEIITKWALGSGMWLAIGAMELGATPAKAVDVAKKYDLYCGGLTKRMKIKLSKNK